MKKYFMVSAGLFLALSFFACNQSKVPAVVKTAFNKKFPAVKKVDWDKEGKTQWEAEFDFGGKEMSANFDLQGNWKETETELKKDEIPPVVKDSLTAQYPDYKVKEVAFTETPEFSAYEIVIKKDKSKLEIMMDKTGKVLRKENHAEDKD